MVKVVHDNDLNSLHKYTQRIAKDFAEKISNEIIAFIIDKINNDKQFGKLTYSDLMTFISTINTFCFSNIFFFTCHVGSQFPDVEHSSRDLLEEVINAIRVLLNMPKINTKEHANGIKKI